jgi:hemoglobin-like flavoprotein
MTSDDIKWIQESWRRIEPVKGIAAELFFNRLFELDPLLRSACGDDLKARYEGFTRVLGATVRGLTRLEMLLPAVREFGIRHPLSGAVEEHHANIASALLWMLEKALRRDFTPEVKSAWIKAYGMLSQTVRETAPAHAA